MLTRSQLGLAINFSIGYYKWFSGDQNIRFRYKLEGYQNEWFDLNNQNEINFAGLNNNIF
jgi:ABC-type polysaccharide/polyol phosphate transport system ATPase subunit